MYPKIKFTAKIWFDLCNFYSTVIFFYFCLGKYFILFFAEFELLLFHNNIVKISEKKKKNEHSELVENLPLHLHSFLLWEKVKIFDL